MTYTHPRMKRHTAAGIVLLASLSPLGLLCACSSSGTAAGSGDPLADVRNPKSNVRVRVSQVEPAMARAMQDPGARNATIGSFKDIAWTPTEPSDLRVAVLKSLFSSSDPAIVEDARQMGKLILPRELDRGVVVALSQAAGERGWTDYIPSLIRSCSRPLPAVEDDTRSETVALRDLSAGKPLEEVVFGVFMNPPEMPAAYGMDWQTRFRADAWDLLGRLDKDGNLRMRMLLDAPAGPNADPTVANIRRALADLRAIPLTGAEVTWLNALCDGTKPANAQWWSEAASAIAGVSDKGPFQIRHAEPVRWASVHRPAWYGASREQLLAELESRLDARERIARSTGAGTRVREDLDHWAPTLRWGDLIAILVLDDTLAREQVRSSIFEQTRLDRADKTTEYGGIITLADPRSPEGRAALFPPRPGQRNGDEKFVASDAMLAASDLAIAHYHFHVQEVLNGGYAGPSDGDLVYSARYGRSCLVFTSLKEDVLNVDYYQPDGVVIDLGKLNRPK